MEIRRERVEFGCTYVGGFLGPLSEGVQLTRGCKWGVCRLVVI